MYKKEPIPKNVNFYIIGNNSDSKNKVTPLVYLEDEYGGMSIIYDDDHCFVLANLHSEFGTYAYFKNVYHWYSEAVMALQEYFMDIWKSYRYEELMQRNKNE